MATHYYCLFDHSGTEVLIPKKVSYYELTGLQISNRKGILINILPGQSSPNRSSQSLKSHGTEGQALKPQLSCLNRSKSFSPQGPETRP